MTKMGSTLTALAAAGCVLMGAGVGVTGERRAQRATMKQQMALTDAQEAKIEALRRDFRKGQIKARAEIKILRMEVDELLAAPELDEAAVRAKAKALADAHTAQAAARLEHRLAVAKVLTPEQRGDWHRVSRDWGHKARRGHHARARRGPGRSTPPLEAGE